jgi:amino acid adenylation domain-containing protein
VSTERARPTSFRDTPALHARFEAQVARTPDATAVVWRGERITYRELNARANRLAHRLRTLGVRADTLVALATQRSLDTVVGILGIVKAGGAYLPIDPAYPSERLSFMLEDSGARVLVTHAEFTTAPRLPAGLTVVTLAETAGELEVNVGVEVGPKHLAYVIYTSGSTGKPKGVLVTQANVVRLFEATAAWFHFGTEDVWTFFHSSAFDFSVWEIWGALLHGGRLVVVPFEVSRSPEAFHELLSRESVTVLNQTPSAFRQLVHAVLAAPEPRPLALRTVIFGGEALELQGLLPWFERFGDQKPRLVNMYGITETTVHVTYRPLSLEDVRRGLGSVIGVPIPDLGIQLLDSSFQPVADGSPGEIFVEGAGLARGYLNRPELTAERFVEVELAGRGPVRLYRTGDSARRTPEGELEYLGRIDQQVKIRGFRIELGEIESVIAGHPAVKEVVVIPREDTPGDKRLVAYVVGGEANEALNESLSEGLNEGPGDGLVEALRARLRERLPEYMVPAAFVRLETLPLTENGKVNRKALPEPGHARPALETEFVEPQGPIETAIAAVWRRLLRLDAVGANDSFFDLGGSSLLAVESLRALREALGRTAPVVSLFRHPTVRGLAGELDGGAGAASLDDVRARAARKAGGRGAGVAGVGDVADVADVAIIGMAGRFPGARTVDELWANLCAGREGVRFFGVDELDAGVDASDPAYVRARGVLDDADKFDAGFFGEAPASAELIDPQQRVLLETAWAALEDAGVVPGKHGANVGVYAGTGHNTYLLHNVVHRPDRIEILGELAMIIANDKDFVASRIAHKLNLQGPALSVHTACSTSLVAICLAREGLLDHDCDIALAGAASITAPQHAGHVYAEGAMLSADGHTRTFDASATGTVFSDGAGMIVMKRLVDARRDGDRVYAVIKGAAINNDGAAKASYTAPSVDGQAKVIALAHAVAGVDPATISYVEAHGTATPLGDPIEVAALTQAFRLRTDATGFCAIGSLKSNLGHLTAASGVAGVIKTALALRERVLPPSLFFERANAEIDFERTPFHVQTKLGAWDAPRGAAQASPRRAGVSSFGVGGTNAHVVLEEAPPPAAVGTARGPHLLVLTAKTEAALGRAAEEIAAHLEARPDLDLADVAYTLQCRRTHFARRRFTVASSSAEAARALRAAAEPTATRRLERPGARPTFIFPGQGTQYAGMGRALYEAEPVFKAAFDRCAESVRPHIERDLREVCFGDGEAIALGQTAFTQPSLFAVEYALACLWRSWGVEPRALVGHSVGEFVAACLADVFSVEDAAALVAARGRLMQALPAGSMLSVRLPAERLEPRLPAGLALAASNGPELCVVSGPTEEIVAFEAQLTSEDVVSRRLFTSHAFHSPMMDPAIAPFEALVAGTRRSPPRIPIVSTATGRVLTSEEALSPAYWARHLRAPVRFFEALRGLMRAQGDVAVDFDGLFLEVGPRATSATLARQIARAAGGGAAVVAVASLLDQPALETAAVAGALGQLWLSGVAIDWEAFQSIGRRRLVSLPAYSFARDRHWLDPVPRVRSAAGTAANGTAANGTAVNNGHRPAPLTLVVSAAAAPALQGDPPFVAPGRFDVPETTFDAGSSAPLLGELSSSSAVEQTILVQLSLMNDQLKLFSE